EFPEVVGLPRPDPSDFEQAADRRWTAARHVTKRRVVEDDIRRDASRARDVEADGAQTLEQIAIDVVPRLRFDTRTRACLVPARRPLARERQMRAAVLVFEQRDA